MQFTRLKLSGFKSFVDSTEFRIEPGLTGIVGPNGCGKSNLLEAMRWVMGATSAKALRGAGMDDVIFSGSDRRPSRHWAEVTLSIDNADRLAPQPFTDQPVLDVTRRIDRGAGSTYKVNGREVRAKDVQLLFADASTGANSPALVRQGQISELINSKPQNRRRVLEEAGGVSGLHTRRHEAELRLSAAETNLSRLDDIARELDTALSRLKREARHAEKYRRVSAEIRNLQKAILHARWLDLRGQLGAAQTEMTALSRAVEDTTRAAVAAQVAAERAQEAMTPLREEEAVAATIVHRLAIEKERLDLEEKHARTEVDRLTAEIERLTADFSREKALSGDGALQVQRLTSALEQVRAEIAAAPSREPELVKALTDAEAVRAATDSRIESLAAEHAAVIERQKQSQTRLSEASQRLSRLEMQLAEAQRERTRLGEFDRAAITNAESQLSDAGLKLETIRARLEALESERPRLAEAESHSRKAVRDLEDRLGKLRAEAGGVRQLLNASRKEGTPVLDQLQADKGYELALAAALGEDLNLSLSDPNTEDMAAFWNAAFRSDYGESAVGILGAEVTRLSDHVRAPEALRLRLMSIGVVDRDRGDALQSALPMGARLVSREGDLWRWDGLTVRARAPKPAAIRLAQRNRLNDLETEIESVTPELSAAQTALAAAHEAQSRFDADLRAARQAVPPAEQAVRVATETLDTLRKAEARHETQCEGINTLLARLMTEREEALERHEEARAAQAAPLDTAAMLEAMTSVRAEADRHRAAVMSARAALDDEQRARGSREGRARTLDRELSDWSRRTQESATRLMRLDSDQSKTKDALEAARSVPEGLRVRRESLIDSLHTAEKRLAEGREALSQGETARRDAEQALRDTEARAASAREARAGGLARFEALTTRITEHEALVQEQAGMSPDELGKRLSEEAIATPSDLSGAESLLSGLMAERDQLGPVNLRAEEEATEYEARLDTLGRERDDLTTAIAKLRAAIDELNAEGRERLLAAFGVINEHFKTLFVTLFGGGAAELRLVESEDPLEAGLEIFACPPGKRLTSMSLMSGGEQALTATALIFGVFLANPAPVCVLDEVDAPLDDANVDRYCRLLAEMRTLTRTRFIVITHNPVTMSRMDRLFGVTMAERGVSQLVSVDLTQASRMVEVA